MSQQENQQASDDQIARYIADQTENNQKTEVLSTAEGRSDLPTEVQCPGCKVEGPRSSFSAPHAHPQLYCPFCKRTWDG